MEPAVKMDADGIRAIRTEMMLTQPEFGDRVDASTRTVAGWECKNGPSPSLFNQRRILQELQAHRHAKEMQRAQQRAAVDRAYHDEMARTDPGMQYLRMNRPPDKPEG